MGKNVEVQLQVNWEVDPRSVPAICNQVMLQPGLNDAHGSSAGVYVRMGHLNPPIFTGDGQPSAESVGTLPVVVIGNYFLPLNSARSLRDALDQALKDIDAASDGGQ